MMSDKRRTLECMPMEELLYAVLIESDDFRTRWIDEENCLGKMRATFYDRYVAQGAAEGLKSRSSSCYRAKYSTDWAQVESIMAAGLTAC